jgi:UDP-N-acetyl-D-galactosamine dehydrogenase
MSLCNPKESRIGIIGLGYVGLPLSVAFGKERFVIGFDINEERVKELRNFIDVTNECTSEEIKKAKNLEFTSKLENLADCNCYIVTVPTPINKLNKPDLEPLIGASTSVASILKCGDIVIYESTVYPGATEEICVPILENLSGLTFNEDFFCGYSPERINPGDKDHRLENIVKITSGSNDEAADFVDSLYRDIICAGTHRADSIKVAEAAKVIENTQRDLNIALINELALIFDKLSIDTESVLNAAGSKWNFLNFRPGLVGGHCIGVDPYYLTYKAESIGYKPEVILAGRKLNDEMHLHVSKRMEEGLKVNNRMIEKSEILILGITFKENCPDTRNTKVIPLVNELQNLGSKVDVYDPWISTDDFKNFPDINLISSLDNKKYDGIILAVSHDEFKKLKVDDLKNLKKEGGIVFDLKHILPKEISNLRL